MDDDKSWRLKVEGRLKRAGYEVFLAADASEAMAAQHDINPDVIILDLNLDGEDGLVLMKFLKRNSPVVPIILYTGMEHDYPEVATMMGQGAYRFVRKGSTDDLLNSVQKALQQTAA